MKNKSETTRVVLIVLFLAVFCLLPFVVAPPKDWYIILIIAGVPISFTLVFGLMTNKLGLKANPKRLWRASYVLIAFISFCLTAIVFYLTNYSWYQILLYSTGVGFLSVIVTMVNIFVWSKIRELEKRNPTHQE